jgi:exodeoxyribonuclease VII small subunit
MASKKPAPEKPFDFEASLKQLEALVGRMESGDMSLEDSLKAFEEGVKLTRLCQETLTHAQQKVQTLMQQQGKTSLQDFAVAGDDSNDVQENTNVAEGRKPGATTE